MKKIAKLSLVAAVAVAGLTTANAKPLEEAIKNVDVSGQFRYRVHQEDDGAIQSTSTDVEIEVGAKVKVTDNIKAIFKIDENEAASLKVEDYYFSYNNAGLTINYGMQNIPTRQVDGKQGNGVVALTKVGGFTVGGAAFLTNNVSNALKANVDATKNDIYSVLATGNVGPASVLAQYSIINDLADAINVKADAKVGPASISVEHAAVTLDDNSDAKYSTTKAVVSAKLGGVSATVGYATTGDDGSGSIDAGAEAPSELTGFQLHSAGRGDFTAMLAKVTVPVAAKTSVTLYHATGEQGSTDASESFGQVSYSVAKNLNAYARYGVLAIDDGSDDKTKARIEVKYSF